MKPEPDAAPSKSAHDRFVDLGKRILSVPKAEIDAAEKKWQRTRKPRKKR